ncbi:quinone-dependent dihydroorotate dehydrogenase [archaeon]|nr:quinone-dependent dihydroorotate dehydrogenase [archaeon]MBT3450775.1 quinone-dependent dihydroorotate dehydrogenase [archaeon]MBT6868812.1 quinone-dependent dihydroorotate dehydrogenase [archaeon]MBT7192967.1 quinone-dependent dihydroorotate dehydrogenase [archaeon]MBT7380933.1 quinone-dependent dihydroorotate dehydrogenase [archaeon]
MVHTKIYTKILRPIFFKFDPEFVHDLITEVGDLLGKTPLLKDMLDFWFNYQHPMLVQDIKGIRFNNPVGLAAGFDKDARLMNILPHVGFGHQEIGSVTAKPCKGNKKPRMWRLPRYKSIVVYYGLKNPGCQAIAKKLYGKKFKLTLGISIAKTNCKETADLNVGIEDYYKSFRLLEPFGDYFTINISCPNAFGGLPFTDKKSFNELLTKLETVHTDKPIFIKMSPDLTDKELNDIIKVCDSHRVDGFVISNLSKKREDLNIPEKEFKAEFSKVGPGGLSGNLVRRKSIDMINKVYTKTEGRYIIMGVGGIFSAKDAYEMIKSGASLVQLITGMIYEGPGVIEEINRGLVKLLKKEGYNSLSEAIGAYHKTKKVTRNKIN